MVTSATPKRSLIVEDEESMRELLRLHLSWAGYTVEAAEDAIFVGEPSSSRPNFVGEDTELLLPYSGVRGSMSSRYFQGSHSLDERVWIAPDIPVRLSSSDYFAKRDPVLEATFDAIHAETQLLFASDWPHWDFDVPGKLAGLPFLSEQAKRNILGENARKLFRL